MRLRARISMAVAAFALAMSLKAAIEDDSYIWALFISVAIVATAVG